MGADNVGKQECDSDLVVTATVFTDEVTQSMFLGETQHAVAAGLKSREDIHELGAVINGTHAGRT